MDLGEEKLTPSTADCQKALRHIDLRESSMSIRPPFLTTFGSLALLCACASVRPCASQEKPYPLVIGLPATARYAGLANAGVAVHGDAGALFINPAGIATIRHGGIEGTFHYSHEQPLEGSAAAAFRVAQFTLGGGVHYL